MTTFVFLGPSLPLDRARTILDAEFLPPVAMGDLHTLVMTRAKPGDRVAIIDGVFEQVPAVWHKEVLHALSTGIHVYGASSMGALRAAELHPFGMVGVGRIFAAYRDGVLTDDDEVATAHATGEQHYRALSTPMISLRFALADLVGSGELTQAAHDVLIAHAKALHYGDRSWGGTIAQARALEMSDATIAALRAKAREPDAKACDAVTLLELLAATPDAGVSFVADFELEQTACWAMLQYEMQPRLAASTMGSSDDHGITTAIRAHSPYRRAVEEEAAILQLALMRSQGWRPDHAALRRAAAAIAHRHGCDTDDALAEWRAKQALDDRNWVRLLDLEARWMRLLVQLRPEFVAFLGTAARRAGIHDEIAAELRAIAPVGRDEHAVSPGDDVVDLAALQSWYTARCGPMLPDPESHARELGFATLRDFAAAITPAFMAAAAAGEEAGHDRDFS